MKLLSTIFICLCILSCHNSEEVIKSEQDDTKPIINTDQIADLTQEQERILNKVVVQEINSYTTSCDKKEGQAKINQLAFVEILGKNPSANLISEINSKLKFDSKAKPAGEGVYKDHSKITISAYDPKEQRNAFIISITDIKSENNSNAKIYVNIFAAYLSGAEKVYEMNNVDSKLEISDCKVTSRS